MIWILHPSVAAYVPRLKMPWFSSKLYYLSTFLLLIFEKVPKVSEDGDHKITETSACSDENDDNNGVEAGGEIEHQTVLEPQPLTVMKARWPLLVTESNKRLRFSNKIFFVL